jgi:putative membrane protein
VNVLLWVLTGTSGTINVATGLFHDVGPPAVQAALLTLPLVLFACAHGSIHNRFRDILVFAIICVAVSNAFENASILTGFPFGRYEYTAMLGPKVFQVPILIGPVFFAIGYLSWMLARIILGATNQRQAGHFTLSVPLVASFILVAWNLSFDPLASTVRQTWIWKEGGSYFGVPVTNFFGWYLTGYVFFQLYALYLRHRDDGVGREPRSRDYWLQAVVLYGTVAAIVILSAFTVTTPASITDQAGVIWRIRDVYAACALVCCLTMGAFTVLGLVKVLELPARS